VCSATKIPQLGTPDPVTESSGVHPAPHVNAAGELVCLVRSNATSRVSEVASVPGVATGVADFCGVSTVAGSTGVAVSVPAGILNPSAQRPPGAPVFSAPVAVLVVDQPPPPTMHHAYPPAIPVRLPPVNVTTVQLCPVGSEQLARVWVASEVSHAKKITTKSPSAAPPVKLAAIEPELPPGFTLQTSTRV